MLGDHTPPVLHDYFTCHIYNREIEVYTRCMLFWNKHEKAKGKQLLVPDFIRPTAQPL